MCFIPLCTCTSGVGTLVLFLYDPENVFVWLMFRMCFGDPENVFVWLMVRMCFGDPENVFVWLMFKMCFGDPENVFVWLMFRMCFGDHENIFVWLMFRMCLVIWLSIVYSATHYRLSVSILVQVNQQNNTRLDLQLAKHHT